MAIRGRKPLYILTHEREAYLRAHWDSGVLGRPKRVSQRLGVPQWRAQRWAAAMGLTTTRDVRKWTRDELAFLDEWTGVKGAWWIAKQLKRPVASVARCMKRRGLGRRVEAYTQRELSELFGVSHHRVRAWLNLGWLSSEKAGTGREHDFFAVTPEAVRRFLRDHPDDFDLRRVDQLWFMDIVFSGRLAKGADMRHNGDGSRAIKNTGEKEEAHGHHDSAGVSSPHGTG